MQPKQPTTETEFVVLALDHAPALVVLVTHDREVAGKTAERYKAQNGGRVVVATVEK